MNAEPAILIEERADARILIATLNRPERANAIDWDVAQALLDLAQRVEGSSHVDAVLITARGKVFCGGGDVALFRLMLGGNQAPEALAQTLDRLAETVHAALLRLVQSGKLLVAAVNGPATGAGLGLICACDVAFARPGASLRAGFSRLGLSPDTGTSYFLPRIVGYRRAVTILLSTEALSAERAQALGIYQELIDAQEMDFSAAVLARTRDLIAAGAAVRETLELLRRSAGSTLGEHLAGEREKLVRLAGDPQVLARLRSILG